ncbi:reprolysin-like metallopeptidase [Chiayiivirga flava]|uniref:Putative repeat protein (TIGR01451 family) n=1 Tax=Chiayiivirga flava TaxID=659595 RepID=A0A7W8D7U5_9GAMM|nr:zinc-dependent metalloprotease family protein [Chiayiivirga flava]MBB5209509.1 putative repeat protein (TIGR01451 family) [Chiayiivirga flava]
MSSIAWRRARRWACLVLLPGAMLPAAALQAQTRAAWTELEGRDAAASAPVAAGVRVFDVDTARIESELMRGANPSIELPLAGGGFATFAIRDSGTMHPALAAKFPEIRSLRGEDGQGRRLRLDVSPAGINAMIFADDGVQVIRPRAIGDSVHESFAREDYTGPRQRFECDVKDASPLHKALHRIDGHGHAAAKTVTGDERRSYRLAVAGTGEYTTFHGGTVALGQAAIVTTINRVNEVYETDLSVHLELVPNNNLIVYTNGGTDPYSNGNPGTMIGQNVTNLNAVIGSANYDVGHVFGTNSGGLAGLGVICGSSKASGVTGNGAPVGDPFDIDYVAHELGHQFGANHTFNGTASSCGGGNRSLSSAYEPGSGSTIMAYAGICGAQDLQPNSDPYFHARSLLEIQNRITSATCDAPTPTGNTAPELAMPVARTIPARTPFALLAEGSDVDGDMLTYTWEQYDLGSAQSGANPSPTATTGPLVRSFDPTPDPERLIPRLSTLLGGPAATGEVLPAVNRTMTFRVTARDNNPAGGATQSADVTLTVRDTGAAFAITDPNTAGTTWTCGSDVPVSWNVAGTDAAPIACDAVDLSLSQDGGVTFAHTLASGVPNTGSALVRVPFAIGTSTRVQARCSDNIFLDIGNANFSVVDAGEPVPQDDAAAASPEDTARTFTAAELGANDTLGAGAAVLAGIDNVVGGTAELVDGEVVFTPTPDTSGPAGFDYTLADSCERTAPAPSSASVVFDVLPVNDAPTLAPLPDVALVATPGASGSVEAFAGVASFGPDDEAGQAALEYVVVVDSDPAGVVDSLAIDAAGTLQYVLTGAAGQVQVSVTVRDDGGTDNGGIDLSAPRTFALQAQAGVDVRVSKSDGRNVVQAGEAVSYVLTMANAGATPVAGAQLFDTLPPLLQDATWTCSAIGTACPVPDGSGNVDLTAALPVGASVTVTVTATVAGAIGETVSNTASALPVSSLETEMTPEDNSATDETRIVGVAIFADGFESVAE